MGSPTGERIELDDGWIEVRMKSTLRDLEHVEKRVLENGGEATPSMQVIYALEKRILAWSFQDAITPDTIRDLLGPEAIVKFGEALRRPNPSAPSSDGGEQSPESEGASRSDGD